MMSPRTANYVEAMIREGDNFDYRRWLRRVREEEAEAKQVPGGILFGRIRSFRNWRFDQYAGSPRCMGKFGAGAPG